MPSLAWLPWATPAFQEAQRTRRPVLLLIDTAWSSASRHIREDLLTRDAVVARVRGRFVPVHVDADWRPDIADRYGLGAWPTLLALTPEGHVLGGGTGVLPDFEAWLDRTSQLFGVRDGRLPPPPPFSVPAPLPVQPEDGLAETCAALAGAVADDGAFGGDGRPVVQPALAALACASAGAHDDLADAAVLTIDRMLASPRWDAATGILRVRGRDAYEAGEPFGRLDEQAEWVRLLACACVCEPRPSWRSALEQAAEGLRGAFAHPSRPAWTMTSARRDVATTSPDAPLLVDATARACRALVAAADVLEAPELAAAAIAAIEHVVPAAYGRGAGVAHVLTHRAHGPALLADTVLVAHALLAAQPWRADPVYRDLADELVRSARSRLTLPCGALADRRATLAGANGVGRLADPFVPLDANADLARLLLHLPAAGDDGGREDACRILRGVHADARAAGAFAAPAALAWAAVLSPEHPMSLW